MGVLIDSLVLGVSGATALNNLAAALVGCAVGTAVGVLPGLSAAAAVAVLLPAAHALGATPALVMLAGVYYGAQYGGSTAAILIDEPGGASASAAAADGHHLARQGRAGAALATAALGSFVAGCIATLVIAVFAPALTAVGFRFGPAEYASLIALGLVGAVVLSSGSLVKALAMIVVGLLLGQLHADATTSTPRPGFGVPLLAGGLGVAAIAIGLFALGDIVSRLGQPAVARAVVAHALGRPWPTPQDFREAGPAVLRGTVLGSVLGVLPGGGALLSSIASYTLERAVVRRPSRPFGQGAIQGVAGPEAANNAGAQASFIPMLALGIPPNAVTALLIAALAMHGIAPGPQVMGGHPDLFWSLIASMWIGNVILLLLNLPLVGMWSRLLALPYRCVFPAVAGLAALALYASNGRPFDVFLGAGFGVLGYLLHKLQCEPVPLLLAFVLGPSMEAHVRHALQLSDGDWGMFVTRPLSAGLLMAAMAMVLLGALPAIRRRRDRTFVDQESAL